MAARDTLEMSGSLMLIRMAWAGARVGTEVRYPEAPARASGVGENDSPNSPNSPGVPKTKAGACPPFLTAM